MKDILPEKKIDIYHLPQSTVEKRKKNQNTNESNVTDNGKGYP